MATSFTLPGITAGRIGTILAIARGKRSTRLYRGTTRSASEPAAPSIAIFDYRIAPTNFIGSCHRRMLEALSSDYDFTVFAIEFDNPSPERIHFQRIPVPRRPLALLYVAYHIVAPTCYWLHRLRRRRRFDLVQTVESNLCFGTIAYTHFCHRAYLRVKVPTPARMQVRHHVLKFNHRLRAAVEPWIYQRVDHIVAPSLGLFEELTQEYPMTRDKIRVLYNPVDTERMCRPDDFDRASLRLEAGWTKDDRVLVFVALGHFERKGLPLLLEALRRIPTPGLKLFVVGGQPGAVAAYRAQARRLGLQDRVLFAGHCNDVRPYLWSADAFVFPSHYEAFPLVALEAAAAGLALIATPVHGVREMIRDGENGIVIAANTGSVVEALTRFVSLDRTAVRAMGAQAALDAGRFALDRYPPQWKQFYDQLTKKTDDSMA
jgi:glycosyltransferase involved in cell wall biosynthesis